MKFKAKSEKEIQEENLWPEGVYSFEIIKAEEKTSKSGNEMIHLKMKAYNDSGDFIFIDDYLLESMAFKLRHAAAVCGLLDKYETGFLNGYDFEGKTGSLKLVVQKDKTGNYADKNSVKDYIVPKDGVSSVSDTLGDDEIPF